MSSIWELREDGMERCIYDGTGEDYRPPIGEGWILPADAGYDSLLETENSVELTKGDVFLEMV